MRSFLRLLSAFIIIILVSSSVSAFHWIYSGTELGLYTNKFSLEYAHYNLPAGRMPGYHYVYPYYSQPNFYGIFYPFSYSGFYSNPSYNYFGYYPNILDSSYPFNYSYTVLDNSYPFDLVGNYPYGVFQTFNSIPSQTINLNSGIESEEKISETPTHITSTYSFNEKDYEFEIQGKKANKILPKIVTLQSDKVKEYELLEQFTSFDEPENVLVSCNSLQFQQKAFSVSENSEKTDFVVLQNTALEDFFVESFLIKNNNKEFSVVKSKFPSIVLGNDSSNFTLGLKAKPGTFGLSETFTVKVIGHFKSGLRCSDTSKEFQLTILPKNSDIKSNDVSKVSINLPKIVSPTQETFQVQVSNPTNKLVKLEFLGNGLETTPKRVLINPMTDLTKKIVFSVTDKTEFIKVQPLVDEKPFDQARIIFFTKKDSSLELSSFNENLIGQNGTKFLNLTLKNNSNETKQAKITLEVGELQFTSEEFIESIPANTTKTIELKFKLPETSKDEISALLKVAYDNKLLEQKLNLKLKPEVELAINVVPLIDFSYDLKLTVSNKLNDKITVTILPVLPKGWKSTETEVMLNSLESKEVTINVKPLNKLVNEFVLPINVKTVSGQINQFSVLLKPQKDTLATGLFSLGRTAIPISLIVLVILIFYYFWNHKFFYIPYKRRKHSRGPMLVEQIKISDSRPTTTNKKITIENVPITKPYWKKIDN